MIESPENLGVRGSDVSTALLTGYDAASDKYLVETADGNRMMISDELFASEDQKVKVRVDGLVDQLPSCELFWQDQGDVFVRSHLPGGESGDLDQFCVERTTVRDFKD